MSTHRKPATPRRGTAFALALATAFATPGAAAAQALGAVDSWPPPPLGASAGGFAVMQFFTTDAREVVAAWARPTPGVQVRNTHQVRLGQPVTTFIVFRGCKPDRRGLCDVRATVQLLDPAGKPSVGATAKVWAGQAPPPHVLRLSTDGVTVKFTKADALGPYRVRTAVTDRVAGVTLHTEETLVVRR